jgi:hypothetical protein
MENTPDQVGFVSAFKPPVTSLNSIDQSAELRGAQDAKLHDLGAGMYKVWCRAIYITSMKSRKRVWCCGLSREDAM